MTELERIHITGAHSTFEEVDGEVVETKHGYSQEEFVDPRPILFEPMSVAVAESMNVWHPSPSLKGKDPKSWKPWFLRKVEDRRAHERYVQYWIDKDVIELSREDDGSYTLTFPTGGSSQIDYTFGGEDEPA